MKARTLRTKDGDVPHGVAGAAVARAGAAWGVPGDRHAVGDHGENGGEFERVGEDPDAEGAEELQEDGRGAVLDAAHDGEEGVGEDEAQGDAAQDGDGGQRRGPDGHGAGGGADGVAVNQQGGRVVQEAFAFEDDLDAVWQGHGAEHGGGRGGVRRGDDGAEGEAGPPGHGGQQEVGNQSHGDDGEADGDEDQAAHGFPVVAQVAWAGVEGCVHQGGGHEEGERQLGVENDWGHAWNEGERGAGDGEQDWPGEAQARRRQGEAYAGQEEAEDEFEGGHRGGSATAGFWGDSAPVAGLFAKPGTADDAFGEDEDQAGREERGRPGGCEFQEWQEEAAGDQPCRHGDRQAAVVDEQADPFGPDGFEPGHDGLLGRRGRRCLHAAELCQQQG